MDMTATAAELLEPIPAHRTLGLRVLHAADGVGEVGTTVTEPLTNVVGSLHSSGLIALADAAGLAAMIGAADGSAAFQDVTPLGSLAELEFLAPARGELTASCTLDEVARRRLRELLAGEVRKAQLLTDAEVLDAAGAVVCRGTFTWRLRRSSPTLPDPAGATRSAGPR